MGGCGRRISIRWRHPSEEQPVLRPAKNHDQLVENLGLRIASMLPRMSTSFCSPERPAEVKMFFAEHEGVREGTECNLNLALENIVRCVRRREAIWEPLREDLSASN